MHTPMTRRPHRRKTPAAPPVARVRLARRQAAVIIPSTQRRFVEHFGQRVTRHANLLLFCSVLILSLFWGVTPVCRHSVKENFDRQKDPANNCRCAF